MSTGWFFPQTLPSRVQGRGLAEDNFAQESRTGLEILMREALQNPLDARALNHTGPVRVVIRNLVQGQFDEAFLNRLIDRSYLDRLEASGVDLSELDLEPPSVLVIEDFGTTGLQGVFHDSNVDGSGENWNAFWFREGEGAKTGTGSNGRAGQGKITFYRIGATRALFGLTVRDSDGKRLLMGRSSFRRMYPFGNAKYERDAFWCFKHEEAVLPLLDSVDLSEFAEAFHIQRSNEPGLSLVVPYPIDFNVADAIRTVISEFYFPVVNGRLEVQIADHLITAENIDTIAEEYFSDAVAKEKHSAFTTGYRSFVRSIISDRVSARPPVPVSSSWSKGAKLQDEHFPDAGVLEVLKSSLESGETIAVRFPVTIKPKREAAVESFFDVYLQLPDDLEKAEEAYIRKDLLIGHELQLASASYLQKARGLTLIDEAPLSAFLADAEEPTHLKWNGSRPRLVEDYKSASELVRAVRQAMPRLLAFLSGGIAKRDTKALAKYFSKPEDDGAKRNSIGGKKPGQRENPPNPDIPPPRPKPFRLDSGPDWIAVRPKNASEFPAGILPASCVLELAYEGLEQNPFDEYDPFDFDVSNEKSHQLDSSGVEVSIRAGNRIEFDVTEPDFHLQVNGFDTNIRLRARLTFKEMDHGSSVAAE